MSKRIKYSEAALVYAKIMSHHGNAPFDDTDAQQFWHELDDRVNPQDALAAVEQYYGSHPGTDWMRSGDVNILTKRMRAARIPDQAQIGRLMDQAGIRPDQALAYRRRLIREAGQGVPVQEAHELAVEAAHRQAIEAPKPAKPRPKRHRFVGRGQAQIGAISLTDTLGGAA
ncbi:hypothetical protein [Bifidobacterium sp. A11]|uniref:hypothetical protein n=1 Tax=Bifidobacterium sp. A11 TaxID=1394176 RepID=UPI000403CC7C|nr:hypothetical protein [Bifidobacterium sp. A11]